MFDFYLFVFFSINFIYSVYELIHKQCIVAKKIIVGLVHKWSKQSDEDVIQLSVQSFTKFPNHVSLLLGLESPSNSELVDVINWCLYAGVNTVSIYDHRGELRKNGNSIIKIFNDTNHHLSKNVNWYSSGVQMNCSQNASIDDCSSKTHNVHFLSITDGKQLLVDLTKKIAVDAPTQITAELINQMVHERLKLCDPELVLYYGDTLSNFEFLPWQVSLTQFFQLTSTVGANVYEFLEALKLYSGSKQRYGR